MTADHEEGVVVVIPVEYLGDRAERCIDNDIAALYRIDRRFLIVVLRWQPIMRRG